MNLRGKREILQRAGDEFLRPQNRFLKVFACVARCVHGGGDQGCRVSNLSEQIGIRVFGAIHIHTGEGIGVGPFFGLLFFACVDTLVRTHAHTQRTRIFPMPNHSEGTQRLIYGSQIFRLELTVKKQHYFFFFTIIIVCSITDILQLAARGLVFLIHE